jgi:hypothetical protein
MNDYKETFLIEYFKEMRAEINLRVGNHNKLVATKVVTCGALLGFLLTKTLNPNLATYGFLLVPIISMLYDIMIAKNIRCIHRIGTFIRDVIEETLLPQIELWEKFAGQKDIRVRNYGKVDILFLSIFDFATIMFPVIMFWINCMKYQSVIFGIVLFCLQVFVIVLMFKWILFFVPSKKI